MMGLIHSYLPFHISFFTPTLCVKMCTLFNCENSHINYRYVSEIVNINECEIVKEYFSFHHILEEIPLFLGGKITSMFRHGYPTSTRQ